MADNRKPYVVDVHGVKHTMLLTEEDAKSMYGENAKLAPKPSNKARGADNKSADTAGGDAGGSSAQQ